MKPAPDRELDNLLVQIRGCRECAPHLAHAPRPVIQASITARLCIAGQAPEPGCMQPACRLTMPAVTAYVNGWELTAKHFTMKQKSPPCPWVFAFQARMRKAAICRRARNARHCGGTGCLRSFQIWNLFFWSANMRSVGILEKRRKENLTETVRAWRNYLPQMLPLPHPSWRNTGWLKKTSMVRSRNCCRNCAKRVAALTD